MYYSRIIFNLRRALQKKKKEKVSLCKSFATLAGFSGKRGCLRKMVVELSNKKHPKNNNTRKATRLFHLFTKDDSQITDFATKKFLKLLFQQR